MKTESPYGTQVGSTDMNTTYCTTQEPDKYCGFFTPDTSTPIGTLYFHVNATNTILLSNYKVNATTAQIEELIISYDATTITPPYYSYQDITPTVEINFASNSSPVTGGSSTVRLIEQSGGSTVDTSTVPITSGISTPTLNFGCVDSEKTYYLNTTATFSTISEASASSTFIARPLTTTLGCSYLEVNGTITFMCLYQDTINNAPVQSATVTLSAALGGACTFTNAPMAYNTATGNYEYECTLPERIAYCSIPVEAQASRSCYDSASFTSDATTHFDFEIDATFIPPSIHTKETPTLTLNITNKYSDTDNVNITISQTGGPTIYGAWNITPDNYTLGYVTMLDTNILGTQISVPLKERPNNYTLDINLTYQNTGCSGITTFTPTLEILRSYYVAFRNVIMNSYSFRTGDTLEVTGTLENIGNTDISGTLTGEIVNVAGIQLATIGCNMSSATIPFDESRDFKCTWPVVGQETGITTGEYILRLKFISPDTEEIHDEKIDIGVEENPPRDKNVYTTTYPITVVDRYGNVTRKIIRIYTWLR